MSARVLELSPEQLRELARLVAEELRAGSPSAAGMVDAAALAGALGVARSWVYRHAVELGGVRLGGPRGRLRFDLDRARAAIRAAVSDPPVAAPRPRPRRTAHAGSVLKARPRRVG